MKSTAIIVYHAEQLKKDSTDSRLKSILGSGNGLRKSILSSLDSNETPVEYQSLLHGMYTEHH